jgi:hypothetical protein
VPGGVLLVPAAACHFDPVQFFFHPVKGIVADLVAGAHRQDRLARRLEGPAVNIAVGQPPGVAGVRRGVLGSQVGDELLPDRIGDRRSVVLDPGQPGAQRAFARGADFMADRVIVPQVEPAQERLERESLERERAEHDGRRGQHDQVAKGKPVGQRHRRRQRDDAAHPGPRDDQAATHRGAQHRARRTKAVPAIPPPDHGVEGHVPGEPDHDHGQEDGAGDGKVSPARRRRGPGRRELRVPSCLGLIDAIDQSKLSTNSD